MSSSSEEYLKFEIAHEGWDRYRLADKTILNARIVLCTVLKRGQQNYQFGTNNIVAPYSVPNEVKGQPTAGRPTDQETIAQAIDIDDLSFEGLQAQQTWNVYRLSDGNTASISLTIVQVKRTRLYNERGEPYYGINAQPLIKVKKTDK